MIFLGIFRKKQKEYNSDYATVEDKKWPDHILTLDKSNFNGFIKKFPLSVVDFWAPWCAPCKTMAPRLRRLSKLYQGKVAFGKLNTGEYKDIAKKFHIMSIPNLIFFSHGKKISDVSGVRSVGDIKNIIDDLLKKK